MKFNSVLGKRTVVTEGSAFITLETTSGSFKMGNSLSEKLGIKDGDTIVVANPDETTNDYYIGKGKNGIPELDADGNELKDDRKRSVYAEGNEPFGATVRDINEGGAYQRFSASAAWAALGGNSDTKKVFELGEGVDGTLDTPNGSFSTTMYPLVFVKDEEKIVRGAKSDDDASAETNEATAQADEFKTPSDFSDEEL